MVKRSASREFVCALLALLCAASIAGAQPADADRAQAMERWIEARLLLSKEREEWRVQQNILNDRIDLLEREIASIRARTETAEAELKKTEDQWQELSGQLDGLKASVSNLLPVLVAFEARVRALIPQLPPPIASRIEPLTRRIPESPEQTRLSIGERFQNVIGVLNELNKASREIAVTGETRELADGTRAEVTTMYLGLAQAFYSNEKGGLGGVGYPTRDGWRWEAHDDRAADFAAALAIYRNEKPAAYVSIPARLANESESAP